MELCHISTEFQMKEAIVRHKRIIPIVVATLAIAAYMVASTGYTQQAKGAFIFGSVSTSNVNQAGNGGQATGGGAGGNSAFSIGSSNGGTGGVANGGNACQAFGANFCGQHTNTGFFTIP